MVYDLSIPDHLLEPFMAGEVSLMQTAKGLSTTLVDSKHDIVGTAGLVEACCTRGDATGWASGPRPVAMALAIAAVAVAAAGAGYLAAYKRHTANSHLDYGPRASEAAIAEAEAVVEAELRHQHQSFRGVDGLA